MSEAVLRTPRLALNFAILSGGELISKLLAFAAFAYLARVLGPESFGYLEFALALVFFLTLISELGLGPFGAREVAKEPEAARRMAVHIVFLRSLLVAAALLLLALLVILLNKPWPVRRLLLFYGLTLLGLPGLLPWLFQGRDRMHYVAAASIIRWAIFSAGVILYVSGPDRIWAVPLIEGVAIGSAALFYLRSFSSSFGSLRQPIDRSFALSALVQALPIGASELVWALKVYFATILLGFVLPASEVGWFAASHRIVISLHTFVWLYFFTLLPSIARSTQAPSEVLRGLMKPSIQFTAWSAIFLGIVGTAFAGPIIALIYGPQYEKAVPALKVLIWLIPLALMSGHYRYALIAYDRQRLEFFTAACGAALNILLNLFLVPLYGPLAAASALVASEAAIWVIAYIFVRQKIMPFPFWIYLWRPLLAGAVLAAVLYLMPAIQIWLAAGSALAVYCLVASVMQPELFSHLRGMLVRSR